MKGWLEPPFSRAPAAHRRPGLVLIAYAHLLLGGFVLALPLGSAIESQTKGTSRGSVEVLDPGGLILLETLRGLRGGLHSLLPSSCVALVVFVLGAIAVDTALLSSLSRDGKVFASFVALQIARHSLTLTLLYAVSLLLQAVMGLFFFLLAWESVALLGLSPPPRDLLHLGLGIIALATMAFVAILRDLAWAFAVRTNSGFYAASRATLRALPRIRLRAAWAWLWRRAASLLAIALAAKLAPVARGGELPLLLASIVAHQVGVLATVYAKASWFSVALRFVLEDLAAKRQTGPECTAMGQDDPKGGSTEYSDGSG